MADDEIEQAVMIKISSGKCASAPRGRVGLAGAEGAITIAEINDETISAVADVGKADNRVHFAIAIKVTDREPVGGRPNPGIDRRPEAAIAVSKRNCKNIAASVVCEVRGQQGQIGNAVAIEIGNAYAVQSKKGAGGIDGGAKGAIPVSQKCPDDPRLTVGCWQKACRHQIGNAITIEVSGRELIGLQICRYLNRRPERAVLIGKIQRDSRESGVLHSQVGNSVAVKICGNNLIGRSCREEIS